MADAALAVHLGGKIQVQLPDGGPVVDGQLGVHGLFVHGDHVGHALGQLEGGFRSQVYHPLDVARQLEEGTLDAVQPDGLEAQAVLGPVLQVAGGAEGDLSDVGEALGLNGEELLRQAVQLQSARSDVAQEDALLARLGLAAAADDDFALDADVFQLHVPQAHAAGQVEVAGDDGVLELDPGGGDGQVAVHAAGGLLAGLLDQGAQGADQKAGHLAPGDGQVGAEAAVGVALDDAQLRGLLYQGTAPAADFVHVGKGGVGGVGHALEPEAPAQKDGGLLPGHQGIGGGGGVAGAVEVARLVGDADVLGKPVVGIHIGKGVAGAGLLIAEGPVHQGDELRPGDVPVLVEVALGVAAHDAPFLDLLQVGGHPLRRPDGADGEKGAEGQGSENQGRQTDGPWYAGAVGAGCFCHNFFPPRSVSPGRRGFAAGG